MEADHVLQRAGDEEELLLQAQPLAGLGLVVRIEHLGDRFRCDLLVDGAVVVADVEAVEVERLRGFRLPQPQQVGRRDPVAGDGRVVGDALHDAVRHPSHPVLAAFVLVPVGAAAERHVVAGLRPDDLPGVAEAKPLVGQLDLPSVADRLIEDAELVADAVADGRHAERCQGIHVAGGQASQAAVPQAGFLLVLQQRGEILADAGHGLFRRIPQPEVDEAVPEMGAGQELGGQVGDDLGGAGARDRVHRRDVVVEHAVADGVGERHVPVVASRVLRQLGLPIAQVVEQGLGHLPGRGGRAGALAITLALRPGPAGVESTLHEAPVSGQSNGPPYAPDEARPVGGPPSDPWARPSRQSRR